MSYTREGYTTLTPVVITKDARKTLENYKSAFDIEVREVMECPQSGNIMHACLKIGNSSIFLGNEAPAHGMQATERQEFYLYVKDSHEALEKAVKAGCNELSKPEDMFWGDRIASVVDVDGNTWKLVQAVRDVSPEEIKAAMDAMAEAS